MKRIVALLTIVVQAAACGRAEKDDIPKVTPSADEILEAYVTAMGGREAFAKIDAIRATAVFTLEKQGLRGTLVITQKRPNLAYGRMEMDGMGVEESGCDGTTCWEKSDAEGVRILTGEEREEQLRDAMLDSELRWRELYAKVDVAGAATFESRPAWRVIYTPANGAPETKYFDRKTHLELGSEKVSRDQSGEKLMRIKILDWRTYGPIKQTNLGVMTTNGVDARFELERFEIDPRISPGFFDLPPEVKALRDGVGP